MGHIVLVTGSRDADEAMRAKVREIVIWVATTGHDIIVGDAPGIDETCRLLCAEFGLRPFVYGARNIFRQPEINPGSEQRRTLRCGYLARDRVMAKKCSVCLAIWNGKHQSRSGTVYTGLYAKSLNKPTRWLWANPETGDGVNNSS